LFLRKETRLQSEEVSTGQSHVIWQALQEKLSKLSEIVHYKEFFANALKSSLE
jgi:hypothetical protein